MDGGGTAYLALGSNVGDRRAHLQTALDELDPIDISQVYETDPIGGPPGQEPYLNIVIRLRTDLSPIELLRTCKAIVMAASAGERDPWAPRTLDIDILLYDNLELESDELVLPHPRMWERRFVLQPLADLAPELLPSDWEYQVDPGSVRIVDPL